MLQRTLKLAVLTTWCGVLSCLLVVFIGCTSTSLSKTNGLFYIKVDFTDSPKLDHWNPARAPGLSNVDVPSLDGDVGRNLPSIGHGVDSAQATIDGAKDHLQDLANKLKSRLPDSLVVGLLGYCEETQGQATYSKCSKPSLSFSLSLVDYLGSEAHSVIPNGAQEVLGGYQRASKWTISAYIIGALVTLLTIILLTISELKSKKVIIMSIGASIFITAASVTVSIIYSLIFTCIKSFLQPLGVYPRLGQYTLAATWIATALSLGSTLLSILNACCCCL